MPIYYRTFPGNIPDWRYAKYSALKYPRAASLAINQERLVESVADHAKIRK
jgi:hypothetical protein